MNCAHEVDVDDPSPLVVVQIVDATVPIEDPGVVDHHIKSATGFATYNRFTAVSYKPPVADLFIGAAQLAAEYHGLENVSHIREKMAQLIHYAEVIRACRKVAAFECRRSDSGQAIPNSVGEAGGNRA